MKEFKLNEEQVKLAKELFSTANDLIQKYSYFEEALTFVTSEINASNDENMKKMQDVKSTILSLRAGLGNLSGINIYSDGAVPAYNGKDTNSFLIEILNNISEVMYELGRIEGYSSGMIKTRSDGILLRRSYFELKKSLIP